MKQLRVLTKSEPSEPFGFAVEPMQLCLLIAVAR
jgi:hypothetical protein